MAFLFAAFGETDRSDWRGLIEGVGDGPHLRVSEWDESDGSVRFAILGASDATAQVARVSGSLVAAAVGQAEGGRDLTGAVVEAYRDQGIEGLARLRGDYVYALFDRRLRSLFASSDALGLRAPAYSWNGRTFLLSTRALALLRHPAVPRAWDRGYVAHALIGAWAQTAVATAFEGVRLMAGGDIFCVTRHGLQKLRGDRLAFSALDTRDRDDAARALGGFLDQAVNESLQQSGRCVALSGGVDSCVVATCLAKAQGPFDAFSLVGPDGSPGDGAALPALIAEFPSMRHHRILAEDPGDLLPFAPLSDDPICSGPVLQPSRIALLRAIRGRGFRHLFDGEGGDEIFDIAWGAADPLREGAVGSMLLSLQSRTYWRRLFRDLVSGLRGPASTLHLERLKRRVRARRPWLLEAFWESPGFASAWDEVVALGRRSSARTRLPEILGAHGRYRRAQELARLSVGVENSSPMLHRRVVEFVGSLRASVATEPRHRKALLRHLAAQRVSAAIAWQPKAEPLSDWLIARWVSRDLNVARTVSRIKKSTLLRETVDTAALQFAVAQARQFRGPNWCASAVVELGALVEWVAAIEEQFGL
jgi:asparagine synthetase B (glutamine-hydrolysing)